MLAPRGHCPPPSHPGKPQLSCRDVRRRVQLAIAQAFGISASALHLTKPTFFSRINSTGARTVHDEYWHAHVDKVSGRGGATWAAFPVGGATAHEGGAIDLVGVATCPEVETGLYLTLIRR